MKTDADVPVGQIAPNESEGENMNQGLIERLEPFAKGCFSGNIEDWPQLKPLLKDVYDELLKRDPTSSPYPPKDVVFKLVKAATILLDDLDYDGDDWEALHEVRIKAVDWLLEKEKR